MRRRSGQGILHRNLTLIINHVVRCSKCFHGGNPKMKRMENGEEETPEGLKSFEALCVL